MKPMRRGVAVRRGAPVAAACISAGLTALAVGASPAFAAFDFVSKFGTSGPANGQFSQPAGMEVAAAGDLYVADSANNRVQRFSNGGVFQTAWGSTGAGNGQFDVVPDVALSPDGQTVYVTDYVNDRVQYFTANGVFQGTWGGTGVANGQLDKPLGVAVNSQGKVYVADAANNRIQQFTPGGVFENSWGSAGNGNGQFQRPVGIAIDAQDNVVVTDANNDRVQKFTPSGTYVTQFGTDGDGPGQFRNPAFPSVDADGNIYVPDNTRSDVQKFTNSGVYVSRFGSPGVGNGQFLGAGGTAIDCRGSIFVSDFGGDNVQKFGDAAAAPPPCVKAETPPEDTEAPVLSDLYFSPTKFRVGRRTEEPTPLGSSSGRAGARSAARRGTKANFDVSEFAEVNIVVKRCKKRKKRCNSKRGTLVAQGESGSNAYKWNGRLGSSQSKLQPGWYKAIATAIDPSGNASEEKQRAYFRIVRK